MIRWITNWKLLVVFLAGILLGCSQQEKGEEYPVRVMTYNIRYDNPDDGINKWENRKERVAETIRFHRVDLFGIQEGLNHQVEYLGEQLPGFEWSGIGRQGGDAGEYSALFYRSDRFELSESGTLWLSETPETPSRGWDAALPRIVSWARLNDRASGLALYLFNTHFDHRGEQARSESAGLLLRKVEEIVGDAPVIITGDFNAVPGSEPYQIMTGGVFRDGYDSSKYPNYGPSVTFTNPADPFNVSTEPERGRRIDYIFVNNAVSVVRHGIISNHRDGRYPSDHLPVLAEVEITQAP